MQKEAIEFYLKDIELREKVLNPFIDLFYLLIFFKILNFNLIKN